MNQLGINTAFSMAGVLFLAMVFTHLSYPLLWADEADSVMFGQRITQYGYPKVHDERNTLYLMKAKLEIGVDPETDAFTGAPWVNYYVGALGVLWAERVDDIYEKTLRLRLPYSLMGVAGLALLFLAIARGFRDAPGTRRRLAVIFLLMLSVSVSLILHLREARYYPIVILLFGVLLHEFTHRHFFRRIGYARYAIVSFASVFLLFNTFYPAYGVWCISTTLFLGWRALRGPGTFVVRLGRLARENAPVFLATIAVVPLLFYFDFLLQTGRWFDEFGGGIAAYLSNLQAVLHTMLRFEFLGVAVLTSVFLYARRPREWPEVLRPLAEASAFLATLIVCYGITVARSPVFFERYFIPMSPLITLLFLANGFLWLRLAGGPGETAAGAEERNAKTLPWQPVACVAIALVASLAVRLPEIDGRLYEMRHPYKGPTDYFVPYLLERYEDTTQLVIATNYADPVSMYYLGSHVTIGFTGPNLESDLEIQPDIIVPRPWKQNLDALETLLSRAPYSVHSFEVKNQMTNNVPALSPYTPGGLRHRYATVLAAHPREQLRIYERIHPASR